MDHNHLTMKTFMAITAERDAAIRERNMALEERKRAFADRDMAMLQRDAAIAERNAAIRERDETIASWRCYRDNTSMNNSIGNELATGVTLMQYPLQQQQHHQMSLAEATGYHSPSPRGSSLRDDNEFEIIEIAKKPRVKDGKRKKPAKSPRKKSTKSSGAISNGWNSNNQELESDNDYDDEDVMNKDRVVLWKDNLGGLNEMNFDESAMPVPVCSCTGSPQPCYRWGKGGWQSACCTTTISMYPLPQMANKRYSRVGGRKMSGSAFGKLLNRLAGEGYDFSTPLDLKERWAKHGTNRYSTLK